MRTSQSMQCFLVLFIRLLSRYCGVWWKKGLSFMFLIYGFVPHLWLCEVGSGIRKIATLTRLPEEQKILQAAFDLPVEIADEDYDLYLSAYKIAKELNQKTIYDAIYIALANRVNGVFFTADRSLYHNCRNKRIGNVYLLE
jgi:predicted nucleic acid-binding protein